MHNDTSIYLLGNTEQVEDQGPSDDTYSGIWELHKLHDQLFLLRLVRLCGDHVSNGFVERMDLTIETLVNWSLQWPKNMAYLLWRKVHCDTVQ